MERQRGGRSSMLSREQRNFREKERRMGMKHLFFILSSHVSPTHRLPVPQLIDEAASYMLQLKDKVKYLKEKKKALVGGGEVGCRSEGSSPSLLPKLSIHSRDSIIEMILIMELDMKRVLLHELISVFEEEGAQVINANLHNLNERMISYTIIAQAIISRIGIDPSRIEERLRDIIFC